MFSSADKTIKPAGFVQRQAEGSFFGRTQQESFFAGEKSAASASFIQPKLSVSHPDDAQEKEADQMANRVMTMPEPGPVSAAGKERDVQRSEDGEDVQREATEPRLQRQEETDEKTVQAKTATPNPASYRPGWIQPKCAACGDEPKLNRKAISVPHTYLIHRSSRAPPSDNGPPSSFEQNLHHTRGTGSPMPGETQTFMENRFGADFSGVRIHTGETAVQMNREIHAQAFTYGNDIYFNSGKYSPSSSEGRTLLAHELTHTIQQGASNHVSGPKAAVAPKLISRKPVIHRSASNRAAAVTLAKGEQGKVIANKEGPDGLRFGWQQLMEYFKTTLGPEKILPEGASGDSTTVPESNIRKKNIAKGVNVINPDGSLGKGERDAMPSWCGIFAFWALNKAGMPLKKWLLGNMTIPPEAGYPPGRTPQPGDIAYRNLRSHYALVESSDGSTVTTVNGNTAGADNLGGEIQVQTHAMAEWSAFIDPEKLMEGSLRNPEAGVAEKPKSLHDLQKEMFGVQRKEEEGPEKEKTEIQAKGEAAAPEGVSAPSEENELQRKEERTEDEAAVQRKEFAQTAGNGSPPAEDTAPEAPVHVQRRAQPKIQRGVLSAIGGLVSGVAEWAGEKLEEGKRWLLEQVSGLIMQVPAYKALRLVLGQDPITGRSVEQSGLAFIDVALSFMPGGQLLKRKLDEMSLLERAARFVENSFAAIQTLVGGIYQSFAGFFASLGLRDIRDIRGVFQRLENTFTSFLNSVIAFGRRVAGDFLKFIKDALLIPLGNYIKTRTRYWDLLCLIIGKDPLTDEVKSPTGANILNALLGLSQWGIEQRKKMQETGTFSKVAGWIDRGISVFSRAYAMLKAAFEGLWNFVNIDALMEPRNTFLRIFDSFYRPVALVTSFVADAAAAILSIVKEVLFKWISNKAKETTGYYLLTVLIGKDPFTGERVPRSTENIIKGFMMLSAGGEEQFHKMKESGAMARATAKIDAAVETLGFTWPYVLSLFTGLWNSFTWRDLLIPVNAFIKIVDTFKNPIVRLVKFVITVMTALIEVILRMMGFPVDMVFKLIANVKKAWNSIKSNPTNFFINILKAIKKGFSQFFDKFLTHLVNGLVDWFFDQLKDVGVTRPPDLTMKSILKLVLQVLGISMEKIWRKLSDKIGPEKVARVRSMIDKLEGVWKFIKDVQERGMDAVWEYIEKQVSNLWNMILEAATQWIMEKIITQVTAKLLSMLDPTGIMAVINSCIAIYKAIQSFIQYFTQMLGIVNSFVEGIIEIADGNIKKAADFLERSMARAVPIVIGFLANQVGLGRIGREIAKTIEKVQETVDKAIDWLIDKAISLGQRFMQAVRRGIAKLTNWWKAKVDFTGADNKPHKIHFVGGESNPVLTIRSKPMTFSEFLAEFMPIGPDGPKPAGRDPAKDKTDAIAQATIIDNKKKAPLPDPVGATEEAKEADKKAKAEAKKADLETEITKLSEILKHYFGTDDAENKIENKGMHGNFASESEAKSLNKKLGYGSAPVNSSPTPYDHLDERRADGNPGSYFYVRGHLINDNLGGKGQWNNMTPLPGRVNTQFEQQIESRIKRAVESGATIRMNVKANYTRNVPADNSLKADIAKIAGITPEQENTLFKIMSNEKHVPSSITVIAKTIKRQGSEWKDDKSIVPEEPFNVALDQPMKLGMGGYTLRDSAVFHPVNINGGETDKYTELGMSAAQQTRLMEALYRRKQAFGLKDTLISTDKNGGALPAALVNSWYTDDKPKKITYGALNAMFLSPPATPAAPTPVPAAPTGTGPTAAAPVPPGTTPTTPGASATPPTGPTAATPGTTPAPATLPAQPTAGTTPAPAGNASTPAQTPAAPATPTNAPAQTPTTPQQTNTPTAEHPSTPTNQQQPNPTTPPTPEQNPDISRSPEEPGSPPEQSEPASDEKENA